MFRCFLTAATLVGTAQSSCEDCRFDLTALEEFTVDFQTVTYFEMFDNPRFSQDKSALQYGYHYYDENDDYGRYGCCDVCAGCDCCSPDEYDNWYGYAAPAPLPPSIPPPVVHFNTAPLPSDMPSDHGTLAVNARSLQLKLDSHAIFPAHFILGDGYRPRPYGPPPVNFPLGGDNGVEIHEEFHINGVTRQASYHMESPILSICIQVDLPAAASVAVQSTHDMVDQYLAQAEQVAPMLFEQHGTRAYVNGHDAMGFVNSNPADHYSYERPSVVFYNNSAPALITLPMHDWQVEHWQQIMQPSPDIYLLEHLAIKFDNYVNSVGNAFAVRACEIESHSATQSVLASNPTAREFIVHRIAQHQRSLKTLLELEMNTRFNFIPLDILESMFPAQRHCTTEELAQIPPALIPSTLSSFQMLVCAVGSFAMGMAAVFGVHRMKPESSADDYLQVNA